MTVTFLVQYNEYLVSTSDAPCRNTGGQKNNLNKEIKARSVLDRHLNIIVLRKRP